MLKLLITALQFLTIIPVSRSQPCTEEDLGRSTALFPLVGLVIGAIMVAVDLGAERLGLLAFLRNIIVIVTGLVVTGALHVDGLSDTVDGVACSRADREDILRIMKDSRIGAMGAIALVVDLLLRFATLQALCGPERIAALLLAPALGRWCVVLVSSITPYARATGTGKAMFAMTGSREVLAGALVTAAAGIWLLGQERMLLLFTGAACAALLLRAYFLKRIGGMTGDTLGSVNEAVELLVLNLIAMRS